MSSIRRSLRALGGLDSNIYGKNVNLGENAKPQTLTQNRNNGGTQDGHIVKGEAYLDDLEVRNPG